MRRNVQRGDIKCTFEVWKVISLHLVWSQSQQYIKGRRAYTDREYKDERVFTYLPAVRLFFLGSVRRKCWMDIWAFWVGIFHKAKKKNKIRVVHPPQLIPFSPSWNLTGSLVLFQDYIGGQKMTQATNSPVEPPQCKDTAILECVFTDGGIGFSSERPYHLIGFLLTFCLDWQVNSRAKQGQNKSFT